MRWIGLTGGIASGKTTVANLLRTEGVAVADADQIARDVVALDTPGLEQVIQTFGEEFRLASGELDRPRLGRKIFSDLRSRLKLEGLLHPLIQVRVVDLRSRWTAEGRNFAVYDVPLLFEKSLESNFDSILFVMADSAQQRARLMNRNSLSEQDANARLMSQLSMEEKRMRATEVIHNHGDLTDLRSQVFEWLARERARGGS